jgi:hypothetical protein
MVETIKGNYAIMKAKQRDNYIQNANDWLLFATPLLKDYEHL